VCKRLKFLVSKGEGPAGSTGKEEKMGALVCFHFFFFKGEKTSPAERRRNQKIKKLLPPRGFSLVFDQGRGAAAFCPK